MRDCPLSQEIVQTSVAAALREDAPAGDITSEACVNEDLLISASIIAKQPGVAAGVAFAVEAFKQCGAEALGKVLDGQRVLPGEVIVRIEDAPARAVLLAERVALNFLGHLSGVASSASQFVEQVAGTHTRILDTRKTTPGLRDAEKFAVCAGGALNHRRGLSDGILIKENHIRAAGGIEPAVWRALEKAGPSLLVEVEVTNIDELKQALDAGARMVLLDNMDLMSIAQAVAQARARGVKTEASGNITLENVRQVAETGVDFISIGCITHSAPSLDLSLLVDHIRH